MRSDRLTENLKNNAIACYVRVSDRLAENLKNKAIACCGRKGECDRFAEKLKNNAIAYCGRVSAIALQKTSKTKRSLLWKSECDRLTENLKNNAYKRSVFSLDIAYCDN
ncbi:MAG: hypothetical protein V7K64_27860 [Nostoc sp.]|uniref:hypothetical protein n=1 Tax=unclassified Nostoc TaxID=2593658 RepID=UPI001DAD3AA3|nr:hypothetical protein [Nostoc sp. JL34]MBN3886376.1 hypothetical protein [Nostoc sp. JL34]